MANGTKTATKPADRVLLERAEKAREAYNEARKTVHGLLTAIVTKKDNERVEAVNALSKLITAPDSSTTNGELARHHDARKAMVELIKSDTDFAVLAIIDPQIAYMKLGDSDRESHAAHCAANYNEIARVILLDYPEIAGFKNTLGVSVLAVAVKNSGEVARRIAIKPKPKYPKDPVQVEGAEAADRTKFLSFVGADFSGLLPVQITIKEQIKKEYPKLYAEAFPWYSLRRYA